MKPEKLVAIFNNPELKPSEKTQALNQGLQSGAISINEIIQFAHNSKEPIQATCMEAFEFFTREKPQSVEPEIVSFALAHLASKAPRLQWESAKVIGNCATIFPDLCEAAIPALIENSESKGTVVRWSAAFAMHQLLLLQRPINNELIPFAQSKLQSEEKNSIRKWYEKALKKVAP